jgi:hypothetical protein
MVTYLQNLVRVELPSPEARRLRLQRMGMLPRPVEQPKPIPAVPVEAQVIHIPGRDPGYGYPKDCDYALLLWIPPVPPRPRPTVRAIMAVVCRRYDVSREDMLSPRRELRYVTPRHIIMYLARKLTPASLPEIGRLLGGRDHTTILHGTRKIGALRATDRKLKAALREMEIELVGGE